jgi:hypothetical protein
LGALRALDKYCDQKLSDDDREDWLVAFDFTPRPAAVAEGRKAQAAAFDHGETVTILDGDFVPLAKSAKSGKIRWRATIEDWLTNQAGSLEDYMMKAGEGPAMYAELQQRQQTLARAAAAGSGGEN